MQRTETNTEDCGGRQAKRKWLNARNVAISASLLFLPGLYFGWNWLVAAGLSSVVIGVLPCLAMCMLGLCTGRMRKQGARD